MDQSFDYTTTVVAGLFILCFCVAGVLAWMVMSRAQSIRSLRSQLSTSELERARLEVRPRYVSVQLHGAFVGYGTIVVLKHGGRLDAPDDPYLRVLVSLSSEEPQFERQVLGAPAWTSVQANQVNSLSLPERDDLVPVLTMLGQVYYMGRELHAVYQQRRRKDTV